MDSEQGAAPTSFLVRARHVLYTTVMDYVSIVHGRSEGAGLATIRELARGGPLNWLGLGVLLLGIVATAYLAFAGAGFASLRAELWEGEVVAAPYPALHLSLLVSAFAWAYLLTGAAAAGPGILALVALYTIYYGLLQGFALAGTPWFAVIPLWTLILGAWAASARPGRCRLLFLALLSWFVAVFSYNSLGLKAILPGIWGRPLLAVVFFALVANPLATRQRRFRPAVAFGVSLVLFLAFYALALGHSQPEEVFSSSFLALNNLLGVVSLFCYWIGLDLFSSAENLAEWLARTIRLLLPRSVATAAVYTLWAVWLVAAYLLVHGWPYFLVLFFSLFRWGQVAFGLWHSIELPVGLLSTLDVDLYATAAIVTVALGLSLARKLTVERLMALLGISITAWIVISGYYGLLAASSSGSQGQAPGFWPLLLFVGGIFWQVLMASSGLLAGSRMRSLVYLGFLLALAGIALLQVSGGYRIFGEVVSLNTYLGVVYLGIPYIVYILIYRQEHYTPVPNRHVLLLFTLGMLSAIPSLVWGWMFLTPLLWMGIILATVWRWGRWDEIWDGLVYALAMGLGYITFYSHPILIPVPPLTSWIAIFQQAQVAYSQQTVWPWDRRWPWIVAGAVGAALILGCALSRARTGGRWRRWLWLLLGPALSLGLFAVCEVYLIR